MDKDLIINNTLGATDDYNLLVNNISVLWNNAKEKAITALNTELLEANWRTGQYIVEFEQGGKARAEYGKQLLVKLSKDLTRLNGKGNIGYNQINLHIFLKIFLNKENQVSLRKVFRA